MSRRGARSATWSVGVVVALALSGCARNAEPPSDAARADQTVAVGEPFRLAHGKTAALAGHDLRIRFERVSDDSRCPGGVQCVWAGDAHVVLRLTRAGYDAAVDTVRLTLEPRVARYTGYAIRLEALEPSPRQGVPTKPDDYVATLRVTTGADSR